jgi:hypothetical protein
MKCEQIQLNLLDYSRGLLTGPEADGIRDHLRGCELCKAVLADELAFANRLTALPPQEPVNDVWALVRARTKPRRIGMARLRGLVSGPAMVRKALALTAAAGVILGGLYTGLRPDEPKRVVKQQPAATTLAAVGWSDDPIGDHTDAVVKFIDDM